MVTPYDSFGNPGASGGRLAAEILQEEDGQPDADPIPCQVVESTTGGPPALLESAVAEQDMLTLMMQQHCGTSFEAAGCTRHALMQ